MNDGWMDGWMMDGWMMDDGWVNCLAPCSWQVKVSWAVGLSLIFVSLKVT